MYILLNVSVKSVSHRPHPFNFSDVILFCVNEFNRNLLAQIYFNVQNLALFFLLFLVELLKLLCRNSINLRLHLNPNLLPF